MLKKIATPNQFFLDDPKLCIQSLSDCDLFALHEHKTLCDRLDSTWFEVGEERIAVVRMEPYKKSSVTVHVYIATKYQAQHLLKYIFLDVVNYLKENTKYTSIVVPIPSSCNHVIRTMKPLGFVLTGLLSKKLVWRNNKVDLLYYTRNI
jgi:hypothetical protein